MEMKEIKMVAIDMDGTILNHSADGSLFFSQATKDAIQKLKDANIKVAIATGRSHSILAPYLGEIGLENMYHVMCNGAATVDPMGNFINLHGLGNKTYRDLVTRLSAAGIPFAVFDPDLSYCLPYVLDTHAHAYRESTICEDLLSLPAITKVIVGPYAIDEVRLAIGDVEISMAHSVFQGDDYAEIWPLGMHKGTAVEEVAKIYGIELDEIMAIGDSGNDKAMLAYVGFGVAMGNATDEVKSYAKAVTASIDEDGAAKAIEKYVFAKDFS
jgi:Cof subfamily protein (haloacid dehalogenase superfamily)